MAMAADLFAAHHGRQQRLLQLGRAVRRQIRRHDDRVQRKTRPGGADATQLLGHDAVEQQVGPRAAQRLGQPAAQQAVVAGLPPNFARHAVRLFPGGVVGGDFFLAEAAHLLAEGVVVGREQGAGCGFHVRDCNHSAADTPGHVECY
jgi:hypothetical protein